MTRERAQQIIDAFGPCTTVGECYTPDELIREMEDHPDIWETEEQLVQSLYSAEDVHADRANEAAYETEAGVEGMKGHHQKVINENRDRQSQIKDRLAAIGFKVR